MAARRNSSVKPQKISHGFVRALGSAVLEWLLICLLFIDALFSFFIVRFARYCELQTPCLLCSRLDHVLGNEKLKYYRDLICGNHKLEISSLVFCHTHNELVDVRGMCENCLFSFATVNKSNAETYRLLVGMLGEDSSCGSDEDLLLEGYKSQCSTRHCSCCNEPWISQGNARKVIPSKSSGYEPAKIDVPMLDADERCQHLEKRSGIPSAVFRATHVKRNEQDPLFHVGYTELKVTSDTESEVLLSDDDDESTQIREIDDPKENLAAQYVLLEPRIAILSHDSAQEKLIDPVSAPEPLLPVSQENSDVIQPRIAISVASTTAVGPGLEELNWDQVDFKVDTSARTNLIFLDDVPPSPKAEKTYTDVSNESKHTSVSYIPPSSNTASNWGNTSTYVSKDNVLIFQDVSPSSKLKESPVDVSQESKLISIDEVSLPSNAVESVDVSEECKLTSLNDAPPSHGGDSPDEVLKDSKVVFLDDGLQPSDSMESPPEARKESCITRSVDLRETKCEEIREARIVPNTSNEAAAERNPVSSDTALQASNLLDLSDAYKVAVGNRGRQLSGVLAEQWFGKDSSRLSEDLKLLLSQLSASRGFEQLMSDMSPRLHANSEELKSSDTSSSYGMQILQKRISLERNESGFESLDGSTVSEIEGESVVDRLKRQTEHDRKLLSAMYKELEEERNASADAVNQAMAMITRLQEEKASLHMEALQNLRMMEEQAEYDMEALQKTNDLLAEKEKKIQDLEEELEYYRNKYPNDSLLTSISELNPNFKEKEIRMDRSEVTCVEESASAYNDSVIKSLKTDMSSEDMKTEAAENSMLEFEDEKLYILQSLKKMEKKLYMFSYNGLYSDLANGEYSGNDVDGVSDLKEPTCKGDSDGRTEGNDSSMLNDAYESRGSPCAQGCVSSIENPQFSEQISPLTFEGTDLVSVGNEITVLNERLEALESDQNFLELTINSLKKGEEGVRFIQEIAYHLRELRRIGIRRREENVA